MEQVEVLMGRAARVTSPFGQVVQAASDDVLLTACLLVALVVAGAFASRYVTRLIRAALVGSSSGEVSIVVNVVRAVIIAAVAYLVGENVFHLQLGGIAQALGITTLVVSLGLQDLIKNVVAGIQIVVTHLLSVGDHIELAGSRVEVRDINWRQTTARDKDNNPHVIPNAVLMGETFVRLDGRMARRYILTCDIKPGLDLARVAADIEGLADTVLDEQGWRAAEPTEVRFTGSTANGIMASIRIFLSDITYTTPATNAVMRAISQRGYLADWTNESPAQEQWR